MKRSLLLKIAAGAIAGAIILLACQKAQSQNTDSVVRIKCGSNWGSGAYIGDGLVLTCAHLFRDGDPARNGDVWFPDGDHYNFEWRAINEHWDQALVELAGTPDEEPILIASENPQVGDIVHAAGYGTGNQVELTTGRVVKYMQPSDVDATDWLAMTGMVHKGSSGGPIFNQRGEVIGNLWGTNEYETVGLMTGRTRRFLLPWNARLEGMAINSNSAYLAQPCLPGGS